MRRIKLDELMTIYEFAVKATATSQTSLMEFANTRRGMLKALRYWVDDKEIKNNSISLRTLTHIIDNVIGDASISVNKFSGRNLVRRWIYVQEVIAGRMTVENLRALALARTAELGHIDMRLIDKKKFEKAVAEAYKRVALKQAA